jgi:ubiquinone/menaquinone biosynthesis C-methylase UbiE
MEGSITSRILHNIMEKPFKSNLNLNLLEVGSNTGEHVSFVKQDFNTYLMTDIRQIEIPDNLRDSRIKFEVADVQKLKYPDETFDRVISTCLLHHVHDPLAALNEILRVTKIGGFATVLIPNDPGIFYRILRKFTSLRNAKKQGLLNQAKLNHAIQHRNHYLQLVELLNYAYEFEDITVRYYPFRFKGYDLNALTIFHIKRIQQSQRSQN